MDEDIVETFLLQKLDQVIDTAGKTEKAKAKMCFAEEERKKLMKLIEAIKSEPGGALKHRRREKLYDLLNVMAEWLQLLKKDRLPTGEEAITSAKYLCGLRARLAKIEKDLTDQFKGETQPGGTQKFPEDLDIYRWSSHAVDLDKIHGFNDEQMIMERLLLQKGSKVIGSVGVAGVGKTALSQVAFNNEQVQKNFLLRIWLCLSRQQRFDSNDLEVLFVKRIFSCLGFEDDVIERLGRGGLVKPKAMTQGPTSSERQSLVMLELALQHELKRGQHLIVLDDVWKIEGEDEKKAEDEMIKKLFSFLTRDPSEYGSKNGGTVIVTSRYGKLEERAPLQNMHRLKLLPLADKESCWEIFSDSVVKDEVAQLSRELENLKSEILKKCEGLPLMAKMLGEIAHQTEKTYQINSAGRA